MKAPILIFWFIISSRAPDFYFLEYSTTPGNIVFLNKEVGIFRSDSQVFSELLSAYWVQGYYGMLQSLEESYSFSFGVGHSFYLIEQVNSIFGIDLMPTTYQYAINDRWDIFVFWHSFYSQFANDFGFPGVSFVMLFFGILTANVFYHAVIKKDLFAITLAQLLVMAILFIPMNNPQ